MLGIPQCIHANPPRFGSGRYSAHLRRQESDLQVFMEDESLALNSQLDYHTIAGLSFEVKEKLFLVRPRSLVSKLSSLNIGIVLVAREQRKGLKE